MYRCPGWIGYISEIRVILHCYQLGGIYILFRRRASQHEGQYTLFNTFNTEYVRKIYRKIIEQNDRRRGVRIALVRIKPESESRYPPHDLKIAKALDAHGRKGRGPFPEAIC